MRAPLVVLALLLAIASPAAALPIPDGPGSSSLPRFTGSAWAPAPVPATPAPAHPHMAPNDSSNLHEDAYMTDATRRTGPLGRDIRRTSTLFSRECASVTFDRHGRIVTVCVGLDRPVLTLLDPRTLATIATYDLPPRRQSLGAGAFTNFSGGGYFYLDDHDRAVVPTTDGHIVVMAEHGDAFAKEADYDLTGAVAGSDGITSALPDWAGRIWFVSKAGVVGYVDTASHAVHAIDTHEPIGNSFAVDETGGVYVVSDAAMYRFAVGADGAPAATWRRTYPNIGIVKPGQTERGSGTTPTLMGSDLVAITDNADPMDVVVYDRRDGTQLCSVPVFSKGASNTDQSLVATDDALVAENNYGYSGPAAVENGGVTASGLERIDVDRAARRCTKAWHSDERAPSVVPKLSLGAGLVYTYTKEPRADKQDAWWLTALDFRTGKTVWKALGGEGLGFNNNYAPVTIGPDGTAYVGVLGGLIALRDREAPPQRDPGMPARAGGRSRRKPRLALHASCRHGHVRVRLTGADRRAVRRMKRLPRHGQTLRARVTLKDGRAVTLSARSPRRCGG